MTNTTAMKTGKKPNDHKKATPKTSGANRKNDTKFTSYDTSKNESSSPQKVREAIEPEGEQEKLKKTRAKS